MPEPASIQSATLERPGAASPEAVEPAGLGGADEESLAAESGGGEDLVAANRKLQAEIRKLQSVADKRADEIRATKTELAQAQAARVIRDADAEVAAFEARIAAAQYDPDAMAALVRELHGEQLDRNKRLRSDTWLDTTLAVFEAETGIKVARDDERLGLPGAGESLSWEAGTARVRRALAAIKSGGSAASAAAPAESERVKELERELAELREATGAARFDGGSSSGGGGSLTVDQYTAMSYEERKKLKPADVDAMMRRRRGRG